MEVKESTDAGKKTVQEEEAVKRNRNGIIAIIYGATFLLALVIYLFLGLFLKGPWTYDDQRVGWELGWLVFLYVPIGPSVVQAILQRRLVDLNVGALSLALFLSIGLGTGVWHPTWLIWLLIPIFYPTARAIDQALLAKGRHGRPLA